MLAQKGIVSKIKWRGFTLVELLVVIAIITILASLGLTAVMRGQNAAKAAGCTSNLRQIGTALTLYLDQHKIFPRVQNMPSLGLNELPAISEALLAEVGGVPDVFRCPLDGFGYYDREQSSYEWNIMLNGRDRSWPSQHKKQDGDVRTLWDYESFHGEDGQVGSRNQLFLDGRVESF